MYTVKKNDFAWKLFAVGIALVGMVPTMIIFILEIPMPLKSIIIYLGLLLIEMLMGVIVYIVIRLITKKYYIFDQEKIVEYKKDNIINVIDLNSITNIFYIRTRWMLWSQIGASYLVIERINNDNKETIGIFLSLKDVKIISKVTGINIEIR